MLRRFALAAYVAALAAAVAACSTVVAGQPVSVFADPFKVDIAGSGDVRFGGTANNPDVSVMGSGDVWIAAYTGTLSSDGADIKIGKAE